ncbi:MAG: multidrug efflux SMR transporter [Phycisphaerales bacterium]|nr:multidrug efflux SMR transporter [Phycisphaerales bacterium]
MTYLYLALAVVFEVGWAIAMKVSDGLTKPMVAAACLVMYAMSLVFLSLATRRLDIGVAYAMWAGSGAAIIAVVGVLWFKDAVTPLRAVSLLLVVAGVVGLNLSEPQAPARGSTGKSDR